MVLGGEYGIGGEGLGGFGRLVVGENSTNHQN